MPEFTVTVAERWVKYHEVKVKAPNLDAAQDKAVAMLENDSDVDYAKAEEAGLEFIELEYLA